MAAVYKQMELDLHCALCKGSDVFTIYKGDSLCHNCYHQMYEAKEDLDVQRDNSIAEIKEKLEEIYDALEERGYFGFGFRSLRQ